MNQRLLVLMSVLVTAVAMIVPTTLANSDAIATHKDGHSEPPACDNSNGEASEKNKHCVDGCSIVKGSSDALRFIGITPYC
jgi:hypothetical protein